MRWVVTLSGSKRDAELLSTQSLESVVLDPTNPSRLSFELHSPDEEFADSGKVHAVKVAIDGFVQAINSFGKLRWGRTFAGVSVESIKSIDAAGRATHNVFAGTAYGHLLPEEFADMVESLGHSRPTPPKGLDAVNSLEFEPILELARLHPDVGRVLHLIDLMLVGDEEIDWVAGYAALEIIDQELRVRGVDGQAKGWWTKAERRRFNGTANSPEALGTRARHGKWSGLPSATMTSDDASWLVRRVTAYWLIDLSNAGASDRTGRD